MLRSVGAVTFVALAHVPVTSPLQTPSVVELRARPPSVPACTLHSGEGVTVELTSGLPSVCRLSIASGRYLELVLDDASGLDARVFDATGRIPIEARSPHVFHGPIALAFVASLAGEYRLELQSPHRARPCTVSWHADRLAEPGDAVLAEAHGLVAAGASRQSVGTAVALSEAVSLFERALRLFESRGRDGREWRLQTLNRLCGVHLALGAAEQARQCGRQALELSRELADPRGEATADTVLGKAASLMSDQAEAIENLEQALKLWHLVGDRRGEAESLNALGTVYSPAGGAEKALGHFRRAIELSRMEGDLQTLAAALNNVGATSIEISENARALEALEEALVLRRSLGDRHGQAETLNNIGAVRVNQAEGAQALAYYQEALPLWREVGYDRGEAATLNNIANVYKYLGQSQKALDGFRLALEITRKTGDRYGESWALFNLGDAHAFAGDCERALGVFQESLVLKRRLNDGSGQARVLERMGHCRVALAQHAAAIEDFTEALRLSIQTGNRRAQAAALNDLGVIRNAQGDGEVALDLLEQAAQVRRSIEDRRGQAITLTNLGDVQLSRGRLEEAGRAYDDALRLAGEVRDPSQEAAAFFGRARLQARRSEWRAARSSLEAALEILERFRGAIASQDLRSSFFASVHPYFELYVDVLMALDRADPGRGYDVEALLASEHYRARSLLELLSESRADLRQGIDPQLLERALSLRQRLGAAVNRRFKLLEGRPPAAEASELARRIDALTGEYRDLEARIRGASPRYAGLTQPAPPDLGAIRTQALGQEALLLEYWLGPERSYLWLVSADSVASFELPARAEIESAARRTYALLTERNRRVRFETATERSARVGAADGEYWAVASSLSRMILGPAAERLATRRLIIVGDGALHYLPFGALPGPAGVAHRFLIEDHELVQLPSASAVVLEHLHPIERTARSGTVVVLADPVFEADDARRRAVPRTGGSLGRPLPGVGSAREDVLRSLQDIGISTDGSRLPRLPFTRVEARAIASLVPVDRRRVALDFDASRTTATEPRLGQFRFVHFATHSVLDSVHPELSGVVLSMVDRFGREQDGFLRAHEIFELKLPVELVVLSGCRTGLGREVRGEGLIGLTRAFMYAGAARVLVSLWDVSDRATAAWMARFYGALLGPGRRSPAAATRAAQLRIMKEPRWRAPYYWAAFVLQGEPN